MIPPAVFTPHVSTDGILLRIVDSSSLPEDLPQLEREIQDNAWLVVDPDPQIIFHPEVDEKWTLAVQKLGFDPAMLSAEAGRA